jgi:hypothetical protein
MGVESAVSPPSSSDVSEDGKPADSVYGVNAVAAVGGSQRELSVVLCEELGVASSTSGRTTRRVGAGAEVVFRAGAYNNSLIICGFSGDMPVFQNDEKMDVGVTEVERAIE